jgi:ABC-type lipoprotein export system ATPase subunit
MTHTTDFMTLLSNQNLDQLIRAYPISSDFLANYRLSHLSRNERLPVALKAVEEEIFEEFGLEPDELMLTFSRFLETFSETSSTTSSISTITIEGGVNKLKEPETLTLTISTGEIISIVGPTGAGKSRLLNDIECLAQGDTPTRRKILINHLPLNEEKRFEMDGKLVAQLSQNMNFVMDLTVWEFLEMHAKCRLTPNGPQVVEHAFQCANQLAGEKFSRDTKVTQLSGGQSRALMIADTAHMSQSPIVLIDEIENAGIDRRRAIELLAQKEKIVFISTHDPLLALNADKRVIIKNGGIHKIITTSPEEKQSLGMIEKLDNTLLKLRNHLRNGDLITESLITS